MFKASKVMTRDVVTVREETPIMDAVRLLADKGITGLPVVDGENRLVGMVSEKDMLRLLYDADLGEKSVGEVMTRKVVGFGEDTEVVDICECLIQNTFRRVPILRDGKLVGLISRGDLIRFILKFRDRDG
jgi:CBS domain-containing protein